MYRFPFLVYTNGNKKGATEMKKCPKCGKVLTMDDYETYYDYECEDTSYFIFCSKCGYNERDYE